MDKHWENILILCAVSILTELVVIGITTQIFHSFIDQWGFKVYFETIVIPFATQGDLPYINYFWEYPILMTVPVFIAAIPSIITQNVLVFFIAFPTIMVACNLVTTVLIYYTIAEWVWKKPLSVERKM